MTYDYVETPRVAYGEGMCFLRICPTCSRFVKADDVVMVDGLHEQPKGPNAVCAVHGRVQMPFEGYF